VRKDDFRLFLPQRSSPYARRTLFGNTDTLVGWETRFDMDIEKEALPKNSQISLFLLEPDHVTEDYVSWLNDPLVNQYLECRFCSHTIASTRKFVQEMLDSPDYLFLGIRSHKLDRHIGNIKIGPIDKNHRLSPVGIMIGEQKAWRQGIGGSAINMILEIARNQLLLRKITAGCYVSNVGSQRTFEKSGFTIDGVFKQHYLLNGEPEDLILMGRYL
jgi:[ribosomal protein S5]-alanine N-acetyltransferase